MSESVTEQVARAIYDSYKFKRTWDETVARTNYANHTRNAAKAAIKAYRAALTEKPRT